MNTKRGIMGYEAKKGSNYQRHFETRSSRRPKHFGEIHFPCINMHKFMRLVPPSRLTHPNHVPITDTIP
ncbi:hypothetical protein VTN00DRAFT_1913 [Thermoascus crustaceus]|uniref:uncharacterized protein n=1 Tax=Thermoascus crustaceus TaxID=5088 RepID=UPI0037420E3C